MIPKSHKNINQKIIIKLNNFMLKVNGRNSSSLKRTYFYNKWRITKNNTVKATIIVPPFLGGSSIFQNHIIIAPPSSRKFLNFSKWHNYG